MRRQAVAGTQARDRRVGRAGRRRCGKELELGRAENESRAEQLARDRMVLEEEHRRIASRQVGFAGPTRGAGEGVRGARAEGRGGPRAPWSEGRSSTRPTSCGSTASRPSWSSGKSSWRRGRWRWTSATNSCSATCATSKSRPCRWTSSTNRQAGEMEKLAKQKESYEAAAAQVEQRAAALEGQQAMLATLRTRVERMREEVRRQEESLSDQRAMQEASETDLKARQEEAQRLREELDNDRLLHQEERRRFEESRATMDAAVGQLRQAQDALEAREKELDERQERQDATAAEQAEQAGLVAARTAQLEEIAKPTGGRPADAARPRDGAGQGRADADLVAGAAAAAFRGVERAAKGRGRAGAEAAGGDGPPGGADAGRRGGAAAARPPSLEASARSWTIGPPSWTRWAETSPATARRRCGRKRTGWQGQHSLDGQRQALAAERIAWEVDRQAANEAAEQTRREFETTRAEALELIRGLAGPGNAGGGRHGPAAAGARATARAPGRGPRLRPPEPRRPGGGPAARPGRVGPRPRSRNWPCTWPATSTAWRWPRSGSS